MISNYCYLLLAQNCSLVQLILILHEKAVKIINFKSNDSHISPLFKRSSILKFQGKTCLENILYFSKSLE